MRPHLTEGAQARLENRPVWLAIIFILAVLAAGAGFLLHLAQQSRRTLCTYIRMCKTGISHASDCIRHRRRSISRCETSANAQYAADECEDKATLEGPSPIDALSSLCFWE